MAAEERCPEGPQPQLLGLPDSLLARILLLLPLADRVCCTAASRQLHKLGLLQPVWPSIQLTVHRGNLAWLLRRLRFVRHLCLDCAAAEREASRRVALWRQLSRAAPRAAQLRSLHLLNSDRRLQFLLPHCAQLRTLLAPTETVNASELACMPLLQRLAAEVKAATSFEPPSALAGLQHLQLQQLDLLALIHRSPRHLSALTSLRSLTCTCTDPQLDMMNDSALRALRLFTFLEDLQLTLNKADVPAGLPTSCNLHLDLGPNFVYLGQPNCLLLSYRNLVSLRLRTPLHSDADLVEHNGRPFHMDCVWLSPCLRLSELVLFGITSLVNIHAVPSLRSLRVDSPTKLCIGLRLGDVKLKELMLVSWGELDMRVTRADCEQLFGNLNTLFLGYSKANAGTLAELLVCASDKSFRLRTAFLEPTCQYPFAEIEGLWELDVGVHLVTSSPAAIVKFVEDRGGFAGCLFVDVVPYEVYADLPAPSRSLLCECEKQVLLEQLGERFQF